MSDNAAILQALQGQAQALQLLNEQLQAMRADLERERAENARLREQLERREAANQQAQETERRRYRVRELYREWYRDGLPALQASGELSQARVTLYRYVKRIILLTRVDMPDGRKRVRLGSLFHDELNATVAWAWRVALRKQRTRFGVGHKDNSINTYTVALQSCLTWHIEHGRVLGGKNPLARVEMVSEKPFRRRSSQTLEEWMALLSHTPPVIQAIGEVQFRTNMRPTETRLLLKSEWFPDEMLIRLSERTGCKTGARDVVVTPATAAILNWHAAYSRGPYIFVDPRDPQMSKPLPNDYYARHVRAARPKVKIKGAIKIVPYLARHAGINQAIKAAAKRGISLAHVAAHSGNSVVTIEANYLDYPGDEGAKAEMRAALEDPDTDPTRPRS